MPRVLASFFALTALALAVAGCDGSGSDRSHATTSAAATTPVQRATGRAVDASGAPVEGAFVVLASRTTGEAPDLDVGTLFTDAAGNFTVGNVPVDEYDVVVVSPELVGEGTLDLRAGVPAPMTVSMRPIEVAAQDLQSGSLSRILGPRPFEVDESLQSDGN
jgi:hypothetical protein